MFESENLFFKMSFCPGFNQWKEWFDDHASWLLTRLVKYQYLCHILNPNYVHTPLCIRALGHHWFRWWLVGSSVNHYLNKCSLRGYPAKRVCVSMAGRALFAGYHRLSWFGFLYFFVQLHTHAQIYWYITNCSCSVYFYFSDKFYMNRVFYTSLFRSCSF